MATGSLAPERKRTGLTKSDGRKLIGLAAVVGVTGGVAWTLADWLGGADNGGQRVLGTGDLSARNGSGGDRLRHRYSPDPTSHATGNIEPTTTPSPANTPTPEIPTITATPTREAARILGDYTNPRSYEEFVRMAEAGELAVTPPPETMPIEFHEWVRETNTALNDMGVGPNIIIPLGGVVEGSIQANPGHLGYKTPEEIPVAAVPTSQGVMTGAFWRAQINQGEGYPIARADMFLIGAEHTRNFTSNYGDPLKGVCLDGREIISIKGAPYDPVNNPEAFNTMINAGVSTSQPIERTSVVGPDGKYTKHISLFAGPGNVNLK